LSFSARGGGTTGTTDHHSEYLETAREALTPEGRKRVDELLEELDQAGGNHESVLRFARVREAEADAGHTGVGSDPEPGDALSPQELDVLIVGFRRIRDQEPLDDVGNWANAVIALLEDERERRR
jgi:hypothetical protein